MTTVEFTIRETVYYTGRIEIDLAKWEALYGDYPSLDQATEDDFRGYLDHFGGDVEERNGDVDGQDWFDFAIVGAIESGGM